MNSFLCEFTISAGLYVVLPVLFTFMPEYSMWWIIFLVLIIAVDLLALKRKPNE